MEPTLRSMQVLKQEAEDNGLQGKDIAEYVTRQQTLDREERAAWREAQKRQVEIQMAELHVEDKKRADELQAEREKRADEIRFAQIEAAKEQAKIEAKKELALKELELKAQQSQASTSPAATPPPRNKDAKSPKLPSFIDEKDELDSYLLRFERFELKKSIPSICYLVTRYYTPTKCTQNRRCSGGAIIDTKVIIPTTRMGL